MSEISVLRPIKHEEDHETYAVILRFKPAFKALVRALFNSSSLPLSSAVKCLEYAYASLRASMLSPSRLLGRCLPRRSSYTLRYHESLAFSSSVFSGVTWSMRGTRARKLAVLDVERFQACINEGIHVRQEKHEQTHYTPISELRVAITRGDDPEV